MNNNFTVRCVVVMTLSLGLVSTGCQSFKNRLSDMAFWNKAEVPQSEIVANQATPRPSDQFTPAKSDEKATIASGKSAYEMTPPGESELDTSENVNPYRMVSGTDEPSKPAMRLNRTTGYETDLDSFDPQPASSTEFASPSNDFSPSRLQANNTGDFSPPASQAGFNPQPSFGNDTEFDPKPAVASDFGASSGFNPPPQYESPNQYDPASAGNAFMPSTTAGRYPKTESGRYSSKSGFGNGNGGYRKTDANSYSAIENNVKDRIAKKMSGSIRYGDTAHNPFVENHSPNGVQQASGISTADFNTNTNIMPPAVPAVALERDGNYAPGSTASSHGNRFSATQAVFNRYEAEMNQQQK